MLPFGESGGTRLKVAGNSSPRTKLQGPSIEGARNHRPEISTYRRWVLTSRTTSLSVFVRYSSSSSTRGANRGGPSVAISSVGSVAVSTSGGGPSTRSYDEVSGGTMSRIAAGGVRSVFPGPRGAL